MINNEKEYVEYLNIRLNYQLIIFYQNASFDDGQTSSLACSMLALFWFMSWWFSNLLEGAIILTSVSIYSFTIVHSLSYVPDVHYSLVLSTH